MNKYIVVIFLTFFSSTTFSFDNLLSGIGINEENRLELKNTSIPYAVSRQGQRLVNKDALVFSFLDLDDSVYSLSSMFELVETGKNKRIPLSNYVLTRWEHLYIAEEKKRTYANIGLREEDLFSLGYSANHTGIGCFAGYPLRYGRLTEDGETMLVMFLSAKLILFSPKYERTVFMGHYEHSDWLAEEEGNAMRGEYPGNTDAQYLSASYSAVGHAGPGMRGYAKVYLGDYDEDGHADIVVWRKFYASNGRREVFGNKPVKGFSLSRNEWQHYERDLVAQKALPAGVTGEYLPQETAQETVRSWLVKGGLTWQSGFPSKSECVGEEGELIPAMHDPLLNDPQVMH